MIVSKPWQYNLPQFFHKRNQLICLPFAYDTNLVIFGNISFGTTRIHILSVWVPGFPQNYRQSLNSSIVLQGAFGLVSFSV